MPNTLKAKLAHVPARGMMIFFITVLIVGYYHRGYLLALWIFGWFSFFMGKMAFAVKKRVEEKQAQQRETANPASESEPSTTLHD